MDERALEWLEILARLLLVAAALVLVLSVIVTIAVATTESSLPGLDELERQGRGVAAVGALAGGIAGAGILAGLGGILRVLVADRRDRAGA